MHLFGNPEEWLDFRTAKPKATFPDFKHYLHPNWSLWLTGDFGGAPSWVIEELNASSYTFSPANANPIEIARRLSVKRQRPSPPAPPQDVVPSTQANDEYLPDLHPTQRQALAAFDPGLLDGMFSMEVYAPPGSRLPA